MDALEQVELRQIQINILKHFDAFCKENGLTYFLSNGTLLGAVKYQGFIPWDDDIDVCMPRESFDKLLLLYNNDDHPDFHLYSLNDELQFYFPFAKLSDTRTVILEKNVINGKGLGVNIDIFPLDAFGDNKEQVKKIFTNAQKLRKNLLWSKMIDFGAWGPKYVAKKCISRYFRHAGGNGPMHFCQSLEKLAKMHRTDRYVGNVVWGFYGEGEAHEKAVFDTSVDVVFEGDHYPAPVGFDAYLRKLYGNYEEDPPIEKQVTHHGFTAFYKENS